MINFPTWRSLLTLVLLVVTVVVIGAMAYLVIAPIGQVKVTGGYQYATPAQVQARLAPYLKENWLKINLPEMKKKLLAIPGVKSVALTRHWPSDLQVAFSIDKPLAYWVDRNKVLTVSGQVIAPIKPVELDLPVFIGSIATRIKMINVYDELNTKASPEGVKITKVILSPSGLWQVQTQTWSIDLSAEPISSFVKFISVYDRAKEDNKGRVISHVNMIYRNGFSVAWSPNPKTATTSKKNKF